MQIEKHTKYTEALIKRGSCLPYFRWLINWTYHHRVHNWCTLEIPYRIEYVTPNDLQIQWRYVFKNFDMMSWHENTFRVTGPLWGESTGHRWFILTAGQ